MTDEQLDAIAVEVLMRERKLTREEAEYWMSILSETVKLHRAMILAGLRAATRVAAECRDGHEDDPARWAGADYVFAWLVEAAGDET